MAKAEIGGLKKVVQENTVDESGVWSAEGTEGKLRQ